jgi:hypothetical protein
LIIISYSYLVYSMTYGSARTFERTQRFAGFTLTRVARNEAARRGARRMPWLAATTQRLRATTHIVDLTLDSQSGDNLPAEEKDETADAHARKRRRCVRVSRTQQANEADDDIYAPPVSVLNRGKRHLTDEEAAQFVRVALFAQRDRVVSMGDLCKRWRLSRSQGYELLGRFKENGHVRRAPRSGRPKVITPRLEKVLVNICDEKQGRVTLAELTAALNERDGTSIATETVRRSCKVLFDPARAR